MNLDSVLLASDIVRATIRNARVAVLLDDGNVIYGTARRIHGGQRDDEDIRNAELEITLDSGREYPVNVGVAMQWARKGDLVIDAD